MLGPGDVAGEMAVVSRRPRNADVVCVTDVTVRVFTPREFRSLRHRDPEFAASLDERHRRHECERRAAARWRPLPPVGQRQ